MTTNAPTIDDTEVADDGKPYAIPRKNNKKIATKPLTSKGLDLVSPANCAREHFLEKVATLLPISLQPLAEERSNLLISLYTEECRLENTISRLVSLIATSIKIFPLQKQNDELKIFVSP